MVKLKLITPCDASRRETCIHRIWVDKKNEFCTNDDNVLYGCPMFRNTGKLNVVMVNGQKHVEVDE